MSVKTHADLFSTGSIIHENPRSIINKHSFFNRSFLVLSMLLLPFLSKATPGLFDFLATGQGVQQGLPTVIIFYEPDCAHCKKMSSQLQEAAGFDKAIQQRFYVELADITTAKGKELARRFNIHAVPAIVQPGIAMGKYNTINGFPGVDKLAELLQINYKLPATLSKQQGVDGGAPLCGNGIAEAGEQCDDGNTTSGDGCSASCQLEAVPKGVAINETGQLPDVSSILDVSSSGKGVLIPRVSDNEMQNIVSPANGLLVYNTDAAALAYRDADKWVFIKGGSTAGNDWNTNGNAGIGATNFIGTTNDADLIFKRNSEGAGWIGQSNTGLGIKTLGPSSTGSFNTAIGGQSLYYGTSGNFNTSVGFSALTYDTSGSFNTASGAGAFFSNSNGSAGTAAGYQALFSNTTGSQNTAYGFQAGYNNTIGSSNVFFGYQAGLNETGSNKLYISNSNANASAALLYGEFDNKILSVGGKLGINTIAPHGELQLPNTLVNRKIVLFEDVNNDNQYNGFGINASLLRYQVAAITGSHVFYAGTSATTSTELMRITGNGEVGIGKLPLTSSNDSRLQVKQKGSQNGIGVEASNSTNHWDFFTTFEAASNFALYYNGVYKGAFDNVNGAYTQASDRRLKKDITTYQPVLNNVLKLQAYQYHYLDNQPTDRFSNGFMAQDVQKLFPDAVVENTMKDGETRLGINYQYFTVLAIKGLQEQQQQIQSQEERIARLEALVKTLTGKN